MDAYATRAIPAEVIRYLLKRETASSHDMWPDQIESILSGTPRFSGIRANLTARQRTRWPERVCRTGGEKGSTAAGKSETVTVGEVFDYIDKEPGVS